MLDKLIKFSSKNPLIIIALFAVIAVAGWFSIKNANIDVFPELTKPSVTIFTEAPGLSPEEVERKVSLPLVRSLGGASGVSKVRSSSGIGLSLVVAEFDWHTDVYRARQIVAERLQEARNQLPANLNPSITPITSLIGQIMVVGLSSPQQKLNGIELRELAEWQIRPQLQSIPGVAKVGVVGGDEKQYQIAIDSHQCAALDVSLQDIEKALQGATNDISAGFQQQNYAESLIRILSSAANVEQLGALIVKTREDGVHTRLKDVAEVSIQPASIKRGDASIDGHAGIIMAIQKQPDVDTIALTRQIEQKLEEMRSALPQGVELHGTIFKQSDFIERAINNVIEALRDGSILVAVVLMLFLFNLRATAITLTAIPLSLCISFIVFKLCGLSVNTMTLGGLAVAIGELVDDAIVDVENVLRRLRQNSQSSNPLPAWRVIMRASSEVRNSIVFATILVVLVFIPLFALEGIEGRIFAPLGIAYIVSITASLFVSLTLTPALCRVLLSKQKPRKHVDNLLVHMIKAIHGIVLNLARRVKWLVLAATLAGLAATVWLAKGFGGEFLPPFNEGSITVFFMNAPGTSLQESNRLALQAAAALKQIPEVGTIARVSGRGEQDEHVLEVNATEFEFELKPSARSKEQILADIRGKLADFKGVGIGVGQPLSHRIDHMLSGTQAQIVFKLFGSDLEQMRKVAEQVKEQLAQTPGIVDAQVEAMSMIDQIHIVVDAEKAAHYGLNPAEVAQYLDTALMGKNIGEVYEDTHSHAIVLKLQNNQRSDMQQLGDAVINTPLYGPVRLSQLARIEEAKGINLINLENETRRIVISANSDSRDISGSVEQARQRIRQNVQIPEKMSLSIEGQYASQQQAKQRIMILAGISLVLMFIVLLSHFKSVLLSLQVMLNIPLAFIGAVLGIKYFGGQVLSVASIVGFITLTGIAARNGIMMISHYLHLMHHEGHEFNWHTVVKGSQERIIPVLMTAITAGLALIPLLMGQGQPGREILHPVAVVIFFGLFSSTLLDLVITPLVFWTIGKMRPAILEKK